MGAVGAERRIILNVRFLQGYGLISYGSGWGPMVGSYTQGTWFRKGGRETGLSFEVFPFSLSK